MIDQSHNSQGIGWADLLIAAVEEIQHEFLDAFGASGFGESSVTRFCQPYRKESEHPHDEDDRGSRDCYAPLIALNEFPHPVRDAVRTGIQRLGSQIVIYVADEGFCRSIAASGVFVNRSEAEHIEIGPGGFRHWRIA